VNFVRIIVLALICCFFMQPVLAKDLKIGVVDIARVLDESPQAEAARSALQKEFSPREASLLEKQKKLRKLEEQIARDGAIMSKSERERLEREFVSEKREFKRDQDEFRDDLNFKRNELLENLQVKLIGSIRDFAKSQGFDLLLAEGVVYTNDALNVTEDVLKALKNSN